MHAQGISRCLMKVPDKGNSAGVQKQSDLSWLTCLLGSNPSRCQDHDTTCCKAAMLPVPHMLPASTCRFKRALQPMQPSLCTSDFIT